MHSATSSPLFSLGTLFGYEHPLLELNIITIINTWAVIALLGITAITLRIYLLRTDSMLRFLTIGYIKILIDLTKQTLPDFSFHHFVFIASLFTFILACSTVSLIPWLEEPTIDINTTLALGLTSFFYIQIAAIRTIGFINYLKGYCSPFVLMLPFNIIGKLASVMSLSFRLFGNVLGGSILTSLFMGALSHHYMFELLGILSCSTMIMKIVFGILEGTLQAFIFTMLTATNLSLALQGEGH